jgi:hypothetical protein
MTDLITITIKSPLNHHENRIKSPYNHHIITIFSTGHRTAGARRLLLKGCKDFAFLFASAEVHGFQRQVLESRLTNAPMHQCTNVDMMEK